MDIKEKVLLKIRENIRKYNMINPGDTIVIGLSGGADSVTLLYSLYCLKKEFNFNIIAAHINHGIREEASNDQEFCKELCDNLGIEYHVKCVKIKELAKQNHLGEEEMGRVVRYGFFNELCGTNGKIATAHNKNDNVETVFMRLIRGTGLNGLSGISFVNKNIIRPILNVSRKDIEAFVEYCGLTHVTDKTNFQTIYTRNKIRLDIIPYIEKNINNNVINTIGDNIEQYKEDSDCLNEIAQNVFDSISKIDNGKLMIKICDLAGNHIAIQKRVIIIAIQKIKKSYQDIANSSNINSILELMKKENGKSFELGNIKCYIDNDFLVFCDKNNVDNIDIEIQIEECFVSEEIVNNGSVCYIPKEMFDIDKLEVRERIPGDIVRIDDSRHKKLSGFLSDKKIPLDKRKRLKVIVLNNEVIMIPGYFGTRFNTRIGDFFKISII